MIGIVVSVFNKPITDGLLEGCIKSLNENGLKEENINVVYVPGAFELPAKVKKLTENNSYDCIIALGCIIKGETDHYQVVKDICLGELYSIACKNSIPMATAVLTVNNYDQALERSDIKKKNLGNRAAEVCCNLIKTLRT